MKRFMPVFLTLILIFSGCAVQKSETENRKSNIVTPSESYIKAVWLSYRELSEMINGADEQSFREEALEVITNLTDTGLNTLIVHAVAFCDSFYKSRILPESKYSNGKIGSYDPFGIICEMCSLAGISVQAWINPYRVSTENDISLLNENSPARKMYEKNKNELIITESGIFLNPASMNTQKLILSYCRELAEKYEISAIHLDDYFYPSKEVNIDKQSFEQFRKSGGTLTLENWRRQNVTSLISSLHLLTKQNGIELCISPIADIEKNFSLKFADIRFWIDSGLIDIVIPQIYFGFENQFMPFEKCIDEWIEITNGSKTRLAIGLAFYKCGHIDENAGTGKNEWIDNSDVISRETELILGKNTIYGVSFFSYSYIFGKKIVKNAKKELQMLKSMLY